jgi:hypothetical protein
MTIDIGMTAVGTIEETIGAETTGVEITGVEITGVEITGVESRPAERLNVGVTGNATRIGLCGTATRTTTATIVASAKPRDQSAKKPRPL